MTSNNVGQSALAHVMIGLALYVSAPSPLPLSTDPNPPPLEVGSLCPPILVLLAVIFTLYPYYRQRVFHGHLVCIQQTLRGNGSVYGRYGFPVAHRRSRRSTRPRRTMASTRPTFTTPPRCLLPCERSPPSLPTSLADAPLDVLTLAAF